MAALVRQGALLRAPAFSRGLNAAASAEILPPLVDVSLDASDSRKLELRWNDGRAGSFDARWLRTNCSSNFHSSGQRLKSPGQFNRDLFFAGADLCMDSQQLQVAWSDGAVPSTFCIQWLRHHSDKLSALASASAPQASSARAASREEPESSSSALISQGVPRMQYAEVASSPEARLQFLGHVYERGICIVGGVPGAEGEVKRFAERAVGVPVSHTLLYGDVFDVRDEPDPMNIAYTSLELKPHQDLAYYESPPGLQLLHCLRFDDGVRGGASTFLDVHYAAERLRNDDPAAFATLCRVPATFQKEHMARDFPVLMRYQRPHIALNAQGQVAAVFWAPQFEGALCVPTEDVAPYYDAYAAFERVLSETPVLRHRMAVGDMVVFNNRTVLHGRDAFDSADGLGVRHFQGTYVNIDEFVCAYRVLKRQLNAEDGGEGHGNTAERLRCVGNGDYLVDNDQ